MTVPVVFLDSNLPAVRLKKWPLNPLKGQDHFPNTNLSHVGLSSQHALKFRNGQDRLDD
jgi:hypothetical protein